MTTKQVLTATSTGAGRQVLGQEDLYCVRFITEQITVAQFTDGGSTAGTYQMAGTVPVGAILLASKIVPVAGFAGDTSAVIIVGDGSDTDRYMTGTPNVFVTAANGVESGVPSGSKLITTANRPTITITSATDFTAVVTNASGILAMTVFYLDTLQ